MMSIYKKQHMPIGTQKEGKEAIEAVLNRFDWYITLHTKRVVRHYPSIAHAAVLDLEVDELAQRVRIKFWHALERRTILYPHNYIKRIIRNELIDKQRQLKPLLPLPTDEEEQRQFWEVKGLTVADIRDPADEVEQKLESAALLEKTIQLVLRLPPRQRLAMMCSLKERVDDLVQLIDGFRAYQTDIEALDWPEEQADRRVLQASLAVARRMLAKQMEED
jgi:Sigma-70 region 2